MTPKTIKIHKKSFFNSMLKKCYFIAIAKKHKNSQFLQEFKIILNKNNKKINVTIQFRNTFKPKLDE